MLSSGGLPSSEGWGNSFVAELHLARRCCISSARMKSINLVDPASSDMLVSKIKPCMSQNQFLHNKSVKGSV